MTLTPYIRAMGRGPSRARSLSRDEARDAMRIILSGDAAPEAVGALLMLLRYRGEVPDEIAGFVEAFRELIDDRYAARADLDWPSYAAGRSRGLPWFLLSAKLVAQSGVRVLLHGWNSHQGAIASVQEALPVIDIPVASSLSDAGRLMDRHRISYLPLETFHPRGFELLKLRKVLGLRSAVNTVLRVQNPGGAASTVQGVFHPPYRELQISAAERLSQPNALIIKGGGGEFERHPSKEISIYGLADGKQWRDRTPVLIEEHRRLSADELTREDMARLWNGDISDAFAESVITGTAALALLASGKSSTLAKAQSRAEALWASRSQIQAA
ncbi:glycosyl transferase family protein [Qingshengfaniella alkalisoli]|uniref:Glycosyl transferase family protein n=1 Tax=Qingshengfaniella alkalisoli TaxID=2599296 RepID=A0A5B8J2S9_9RHOB|nr:glycosyl transferase family protein [Qingshengfaniella alkalisoli]QDY68827.1 glycosyl transferase family protein [Qingshengfaniella alkalisoli]